MHWTPGRCSKAGSHRQVALWMPEARRRLASNRQVMEHETSFAHLSVSLQLQHEIPQFVTARHIRNSYELILKPLEYRGL